ncbi:MAG: AmmeMemoRadiSam system protein A [Candidatus Acidiferrales bacterium]
MSPLCSAERSALLARARRAIVDAIHGEYPARLPRAVSPDFPHEVGTGVFVTLFYRGQLRGCVGQVEAAVPLAEAVERCAVAAASEDPRFPPVGPAEVAELDIEISLLSPLEPIAADAVEIGRHGLVVERGSRRGLLLPQVAAERHWQWPRFVEETCVKAGLARDAWKDSATRTYAFTAEVFSEASYGNCFHDGTGTGAK